VIPTLDHVHKVFLVGRIENVGKAEYYGPHFARQLWNFGMRLIVHSAAIFSSINIHDFLVLMLQKMTSQRRDQLPSSLIPKTYRLNLSPDLERFVFSGEEEIDLYINEDPSKITRIVANSKELSISDAYLMIKNHQVAFKHIGFDLEMDLVMFELDQPLDQIISSLGISEVVDVVTLHIRYSGELNDKLCGWYRSKSVRDGVETYSAVTQFQSSDARRAFVCFDDPGFKAVFEISLVADTTHKALSNMHVMEEVDLDGSKRLYKFAPTPPMSTYLVAFIVGDYDYVETICTETQRPIPIRIYTPVGKREQGLFSLDITAKVLPLFEKYFEIPYPLTKLDLVAVSQLSFGGMENYGLITYVTLSIY